MKIEMVPIGTVYSTRTEAIDDGWQTETCVIRLAEQFSGKALQGLVDFSHVEVVYWFHTVDSAEIETGARHPRGNPEWPLVGIFAQRGKGRPNRIGCTICRLMRIDGPQLEVEGLDAIDGTPVLDIKPVMAEFLPSEPVRQPTWSHELMRAYWKVEEGPGL